ncbi:MAG: DUF3750 domain-containing protein [Rhizobiaceae bacterium]
MRFVKRLALFVSVVFLVPALATLAWWELQDRPGSFRSADWSSAGILPAAASDDEAAVYLLAARTGGLKGAFSVHSWIAFKKAGATRYERYDKVGWGNPIRHNAYAADGRWYSNTPAVLHAARGSEAERLIPEIEKAIASYPHAERGGYRIWPGPNSNSFVAHVLKSVPEFGGRMPPNAVGRDYAPGLWAVDVSPDWFDVHVTLGGVAGVSIGRSSGIEIHLGGLVVGIDFWPLGLKIPAFGLVGWPR